MYHMISGEKPTECPAFLSSQAEKYPNYSSEFLYSIDRALCVSLTDRWQSAQEWVGWYENLRQLEENARREQENLWRQEQEELIRKQKELIEASKQASQDQESAYKKQIAKLEKELAKANRRRDEEIEKKIQDIKGKVIQTITDIREEPQKGKWGIVGSFVTCLKRYARFAGRSCRAEYWWFMLGYLILCCFVGLIDSFLGGIVIFSLFLPMLAVTVRRYHDVGLSGWWVVVLWLLSAWFNWVSIIALGIAMIVGKKGPNKYGAAPLPPA